MKRETPDRNNLTDTNLFMTESIDTPSLFPEDALPATPARATARKKKAAPVEKAPEKIVEKAAAKPRARKTAVKEPAPETPAPIKATAPKVAAPLEAPETAAPKKAGRTAVKPATKPAAKTPARPRKKTAVELPPAPEPAPERPAAPAPKPALVVESVAPAAPTPAPAAAAPAPVRPAPAQAKSGRPGRPPRPPKDATPRERHARPEPVVPPVQFRRGEAEDWQPGFGRSTPIPTAPRPTPPAPRVSAPVPPPAPAPVRPAPATPTPEPVAAQPAAPAQPVPQGEGERTKSREEMLAAALLQFNSKTAEEFAGRSPQDLPPEVRPESLPATTDRPPYAPRPERHPRHDRNDRHSRHDRHDRHSRHEHPRGDRVDRGDRGDRGGDRPIVSAADMGPVIPEGPGAEPVFGEGLVEVSGKGFGFLRDPKRGFAQHPADIFVTPEVCRRYTLRDGMWIKGEIRRGNRGPQLHRLTEIEGEDPEKHRKIPLFEELTTVNPNKWIKLETVPDRFTTRVVDLMCPIGKGQRGIIVAPPRTGKTTFLQHIAEAIGINHPEMKLIILLVDERPEEVTEIKRTVPFAEIMASSNDQDVKSHTRIAQLAIERARRLAEMGKDAFVLLDSITRVGRAFNNAMGGGGRTMSGGVDARALEIPRKLFASARNTEEAGTLTIVATALIETGSKMDDLIFQEFKGTGNMELVLDRKISDLRVYPAVDIFQSGTRRDELLVSEADLHKINIIRRGLAGHKPPEAIERLLYFLQKFPTNAQMLREIPG